METIMLLLTFSSLRPRYAFSNVAQQVLVGPETDDGPWYFSLNNRRLWVLKRCREEGLLQDNQIAVRVRPPKSTSETSRYTVENCALEAKLMRETSKPDPRLKTGKEPAEQSDAVSEDADEMPDHNEE
jgi:hypothetical protein